MTLPDETRIIESILSIADEVANMATAHRHKRPAMTTLIEEFAEAILSARGKHTDPLELELMQIASVAVNLIRQLRDGDRNVINI